MPTEDAANRPHRLRPILERIEAALRESGELLARYAERDIAVERKHGGSPVTEADRRADTLLRRRLAGDGFGWLSEETVDDRRRLEHWQVWVVDPLDGTREFVDGIPEWCVSIGLVEAGEPVAGGIYNPATGELFLGAPGLGATLDGHPVTVSESDRLDGTVVLASRSEVGRGEWRPFEERGFEVRPTGSVAYKLALVAAGRADATWTLTPKNEWDVAAGVALVRAAGGEVVLPSGEPPRFNRPDTRLPGLAAAPRRLAGRLPALFAEVSHDGGG